MPPRAESAIEIVDVTGDDDEVQEIPAAEPVAPPQTQAQPQPQQQPEVIDLERGQSHQNQKVFSHDTDSISRAIPPSIVQEMALQR